MKIALIMVKGDTYSFQNRPLILKHVPDSLTMGMLHAIIKQAFPDIDVEIYDETVEKVNIEEINADIIGISALTPAINKAIKYAKYFREKSIPVFVGGAHATLAPETCIEHFDSILVGLANSTLIELIKDYESNNLKKIYKQADDMSFENFVFPTRDIYEKKHFCGTELDMVQATFGCSNLCKFCVQPFICKGYHQRPVKDVLAEIKTVRSDYIEFVDPNFARDINYLQEICKGLKQIGKHWFAPMTMSVTNNESILQMLRESGCTGVLIGFESINTESIDTISKGFNNIEKYKEVVKKFHDFEIKVTGSFVIGLDGDDADTERKTLEFITESCIDYVRFTINTPFPGTVYYNEMKECGRLLTENYELYDCCHCVILPQNLTPAQVENIQKNLWKKSYSLKNIIKRLSYIKTPTEKIKMIIKNYIFGKLYIKMNFPKQKHIFGFNGFAAK